MRTIKFKGKEIQNGIWVEGYYRRYKTSIGTFSHIVTEDGVDYIVEPETVGQFTGLTDKNDKEIYEGDILKTYPIIASDKIEDSAFNVQVRWFGSSWLANGILGSMQCAISNVVGNIHDNPDLLK